MELTEEVKLAIAEEVEVCRGEHYEGDEGGPLCDVCPDCCMSCPYTIMLGKQCTTIWDDFPDDDGYKLLIAYLLADACGVEVE
jgi:hypothetical protein